MLQNINPLKQDQQELSFVDISQMSMEKIKQLAQQNFEQNNLENADHYFQTAYQNDPTDEDLLQKYGSFLVQIKQFDKAQIILEQAINAKPGNKLNYQKYFELAQLKEGLEAIQLYQQGINYIMANEQQLIQNNQQNLVSNNNNIQNGLFNLDLSVLQINKKNQQINEIKRDLSQAYAAIAEIYQTDLLDDPNSQEVCKNNILKALEMDPTCLDALYQYADFSLNCGDEDNTKKVLTFLVQEIARLHKIQPENDEQALQLEHDMPTISLKLQVSKLLIEIEDFQQALEVLQILLEDDENNVEVIYLLSLCNFKLQNYNAALDYIEDLNTNKDLQEQISKDQELIIAAKELYDELQKVDLSQAKDNENNQQIKQQNGDDEDEWMDVE